MEQNKTPIALWRQMQAVAAVLQSVLAGASGTVALAEVSLALRPGVQSLVFQVLRSLGRAQALRQLLVGRTPPAAADALLCAALALAWQEADAPYEVFTLVNQVVEAAKKTPATRNQASFINACLRRFLRERQALVAKTDALPIAFWNHPLWWIERVKKEWPDHWQAILTANNCHAPMSLRVNARKSALAAYVQTLREQGMQVTAVGKAGVVLERARPVQELPGFAQGLVSVQDAAAQLAAPLLLGGLDLGTRLRVLDACAAPGGKTAHLLELADCELTALDVDALRCERIGQTLQRLGLQAKVLTADAAQPAQWWDGLHFDAILLDAPCSASGIVRRHPDIRWLRRDSDIEQLAGVQARLLRALWPLLKPGGRLLYCTCSVFQAEGRDQIETFLAHNTEAALLPSPGHLMPTGCANTQLLPDNPEGDHDGFFYALLEKTRAT